MRWPHPHPATAAHVLQAFTDKLNAIAQPMRQTWTKDTDLSGYSQEQLDAIADLMNGHPRKTLDWCTPHEVYSAWLSRFEDSAQTIQ